MKKIVLIISCVVVAYFIGPTLDRGELKKITLAEDINIQDLDQYIEDQESQFDIKPDNEARIVWANDSVKARTSYVLLYIHGFSASWYEGYPVNTDFAARYGCNAYFPRLWEHGLQTSDPLLNMTPELIYKSAQEALHIASKLGDKIILMSTSTGETLSLQLASDYPELIAANIMFSPNIKINNFAAPFLSKPWGLNIARMTTGGDKFRHVGSTHQVEEDYWYSDYRWEGTIHLQNLVEMTMKDKTYQSITTPTFLGYYYKDEQHQDPTVVVSAMHKMFDKLATSTDLKRKVAFPDAGVHCIANAELSEDEGGVAKAVYSFVEDILELKPIFLLKK